MTQQPQPTAPTDNPPAGGQLTLPALFSPEELAALIDAQTSQRVAELQRRAAELRAQLGLPEHDKYS